MRLNLLCCLHGFSLLGLGLLSHLVSSEVLSFIFLSVLAHGENGPAHLRGDGFIAVGLQLYALGVKGLAFFLVIGNGHTRIEYRLVNDLNLSAPGIGRCLDVRVLAPHSHKIVLLAGPENRRCIIVIGH